MDQLKVALAWLKAHHFWVLTVLVAIVGVTSWYVASGTLQEEFESQKSTIDREFTAVDGLARQQLHPNDDVNRRQAEEIQDLAAKVRTLWDQLYTRQRDEALVWPEELSQSFRNYIQDRSFGDDILQHYRQEYLDYIEDSFSSLPAIVDAKEIEGAGARGALSRGGARGEGMDEFYGAGRRGGFGGRGDMFDDGHMVRWHDQLAVKEQLTWTERPSSLQIWVTQEDLWVYRTLLRAIANTNKAAGADRYSNAAVRDIHAMEVGAPATRSVRTESRIYTPADEAAMDGRGGGEFGMGGGGRLPSGDGLGAAEGMQSPYDTDRLGGRGGPGMGRGGPEGVGGDPDAALVAYRYVDASGAPLASATDGEFQFGTEFKRLPVRLVLTLDQRWLPRLIVEMANEPLQIEVNEVRIDPAGGVETAGGGLRGRGSRVSGGRPRFGGDSGELLAFDREPHVRDQVVINGIVYIFYPPDESVLQVEGAGAQGSLASDF